MGHRWTGLRGCLFALGAASLLPVAALSAQEAMLEFPIRPFNVDVMLRQQTFAPDDREIGVQVGITAMRYGNVEVRTIYQYPREGHKEGDLAGAITVTAPLSGQ